MRRRERRCRVLWLVERLHPTHRRAAMDGAPGLLPVRFYFGSDAGFAP